MKFETAPRVEYEKNVLFEVLFQARFPKILKISREEPAQFQEIIRKNGYPESDSTIPMLPAEIPDEVKRVITQSMGGVEKEYNFYSENRDWKIAISKDFVALSCLGVGSYLNYQDFEQRLKTLLETFEGIYEPAYYNRIGLRYRNMVNNSIVPLNGNNVRQLMPEYIFPEIASSMGDEIEMLEKNSQFKDSKMFANVSHALIKVNGGINASSGEIKINNEESYLIDIDCYNSNKVKGVENVLTECRNFKDTEWNIFQWSINDTLRGLMGPKF